jgi:hypothetical protein
MIGALKLPGPTMMFPSKSRATTLSPMVADVPVAGAAFASVRAIACTTPFNVNVKVLAVFTTTVVDAEAVESTLPVSEEGVLDDCVASYVATVKVSVPTDAGTDSEQVGILLTVGQLLTLTAYGCGELTADPFCAVSVTASDSMDAETYCGLRVAAADCVCVGTLSVNVTAERAFEAGAAPDPVPLVGRAVVPPPPHALSSTLASAKLTIFFIAASSSIEWWHPK